MNNLILPKGIKTMGFWKRLAILLFVFWGLYELIVYWPIEVRIRNNAWEDDIASSIKMYFDMDAEGYTELYAISSSKRDYRNTSFLLNIPSHYYRNMKEFRLDYNLYENKLVRKFNTMDPPELIFCKFGIPYYKIEIDNQAINTNDLEYTEKGFVITGRDPFICFLNPSTDLLKKQTVMIDFFLLFIVLQVFFILLLIYKKFHINIRKDLKEVTEFSTKYGWNPIVLLFWWCVLYFTIPKLFSDLSFISFCSVIILTISLMAYSKRQSVYLMVLINLFSAMLFVSLGTSKDTVIILLSTVFCVICFYTIESEKKETNYDCETRCLITYKDFLISIVLMLSYLLILSYHLEAIPRLTMDEGYSIDVGEGFLRTGRFVRWNFISETAGEAYNRARCFYFITALFFRMFGTNLVVARMVSVFWGGLFAGGLYLLIRNWENRYYSVALTIAVCFNPLIVLNFRTARMYSMVLFLTIPLVYVGFCFITKSMKKSSANGKIRGFLEKNLNYNYKAIPFLIGLLLLGFDININTIIMCFGYILYIFVLAILTKKTKYINASKVIAVIMIMMIYFAYTMNKLGAFEGSILAKIPGFAIISILENPNANYFWSFFSYLGGYHLAIGAMLVIALATYRFIRNDTIKTQWMLYLLCMVIAILFVFIFVANHYMAERYAIFVLPLIIILASEGFFYLLKTKKGNCLLSVISLICFLLLSLDGFWKNREIIYQGAPNASNYQKEASIIINDSDNGKIALHLMGVATFYYKDCEDIYMKSLYFSDESEGDTTNIENLYELACEVPSGYISIENRNKSSFPVIGNLVQYMTQIGGTGYDSGNINIYKYQFVEPQNSIYMGSKNDNIVLNTSQILFKIINDKVYIEILDPELFENKFLAFQLEIEEEKEVYTEGYQLLLCQGKPYYCIEVPENVDNCVINKDILLCDKDYNLALLEYESQ